MLVVLEIFPQVPGGQENLNDESHTEVINIKKFPALGQGMVLILCCET